jgi:polyhydroxyalkanoate synthase
VHLGDSPGKQQELVSAAVRNLGWLAVDTCDRWRDPTTAGIHPLPQDHRFADPAWQQQWPHWVLQQVFLRSQQWWHRATTGVEGVTRHHEEVVAFCTRQARTCCHRPTSH